MPQQENKLSFVGEVTMILPMKTGTSANGKGWQSQSIQVTERGANYPQAAIFGAFGDKCDLIAGLKIGDMVEVSFNLKCSQGSGGGWFTNLNIWKLDKIGSAPATAAPTAAMPQSAHPAEPVEDDLPF